MCSLLITMDRSQSTDDLMLKAAAADHVNRCDDADGQLEWIHDVFLCCVLCKGVNECVIEKTEARQASEIMVNLTLENADDFWQLLGRAVFPWI